MLEMDLDQCLQRITALDAEIRAWVQVQPLPPLAEGPLSGVPFGVKDIFDTAGLRCEWGTPAMSGRVASRDAALVRMLRQMGGVVVGKTHTTAFAYFDSAPTRNPRNLAHTPGGSSSGSAAAVAAGMVPFALGSQTLGSVVRPASYCGVVGFKPSYGLLPLDGCMPFAPTLDTAGLFTRTAKEMRELWTRMGYRVETGDPRMAAFPPADADPLMRKRFGEEVAQRGCPTIDPPDSFRDLFAVVRLIQDTEGARTHQGRPVTGKMAELVQRGLATPEEKYRQALVKLDTARRDMDQVFQQFDVIVTPAAVGPAPEGFATTGDPRMNAGWTGLGAPAITIPMKVSDGVLPLGLQLAAARGRDGLLVATACILEG